MKLVLGTAQLGLNYGINNKSGRPDSEEAFAILDQAISGGIKVFDTASAYGEAEEILGEFIESRDLSRKVSIVSKFKLPGNYSPGQDIFGLVETTIKQSLQKLKLERLDGYLLHDPEAFQNRAIMEELRNCKNKGLVKNIGVSVYQVEDAQRAVKSGLIDYIQVPYNIFDQRLDKANFFSLARTNQVKVFARSVFLQGLILMPDEDIPDYLQAAKPYLREFDDLINKYNLTRFQAALQFVLANDFIDYVVLGVDNKKQLAECLMVAERLDREAGWVRELQGRFADIPAFIISPPLWPSLKLKQ